MRDHLRRHLRARLARHFVAVPGRLLPQYQTGSLGFVDAVARQQRGRLRADQNLIGIRGVLHRDQSAPRRTDRKELQMRAAHREKVEAPRMHALRHPQRCADAGKLDCADLAQHVAHQQRRAACARCVTIAFEPQQQRVAAELEQAAAAVVGDREHQLENVSDQLGDLLGAFAALARQRFGQFGESRNIDQHRAAVAGPALRRRIVDQMLLQHARDVQIGARGAGLRARSCGLGRPFFCAGKCGNRHCTVCLRPIVDAATSKFSHSACGGRQGCGMRMSRSNIRCRLENDRSSSSFPLVRPLRRLRRSRDYRHVGRRRPRDRGRDRAHRRRRAGQRMVEPGRPPAQHSERGPGDDGDHQRDGRRLRRRSGRSPTRSPSGWPDACSSRTTPASTTAS